MAHLCPRTVGVGQSQEHGVDVVHLVVNLDDLFGGQPRDLVNALWVRGRSFIDGERDRGAVLTSGPGVDDANTGIVEATLLHHNRRALDVHVDIGKGIGEAQDVVDLTGEVKDEVLPAYEVIDGIDVQDVAKVDVDLFGSGFDIEQVSAVSGDHGVDDRYASTQFDQR